MFYFIHSRLKGYQLSNELTHLGAKTSESRLDRVSTLATSPMSEAFLFHVPYILRPSFSMF